MHIFKIKWPLLFFLVITYSAHSQMNWINVDSLYQPLPSSIHIYKTTDSLDGLPNIAYYVSAELKDRSVQFTADTTLNRRLTPLAFYDKNNQPRVVVNCTFFSFETNRSLDVVIKEGKLVCYNTKSVLNKKDSSYYYVTRSALGINKKREADIAWLYTDSSRKYAYNIRTGPSPKTGDKESPRLKDVKWNYPCSFAKRKSKWKMETAVGGGPSLISGGRITIQNNTEHMFAGNAINDRHPRTAMGYTKDGRLIILVIQGRSESGSGASLIQEAQMLKDIGCYEALNLDGGGSSCMLVNGKETITPSDKEGQRAVPAVFIIK